MATLLNMASIPLVFAESKIAAIDAVRIMDWHRSTVLLIKNREKLLGIFSEQDLLRRVVAKGLPLYHTAVETVMSSPVQTVTNSDSPEKAFQLMHSHKCRHLPILGSGGKVLAVLSMGDLLADRIQELNEENKSLVAFISADSVGGI